MTFTEVHPIGKRILVRLDKPDTKTEGGIELPERAQVEQLSGEIVDTGLESRFVRWEGPGGVPNAGPSCIGLHVLFAAYAGVPIEAKLDGDDGDYLILGDEDVIAFAE